MYLPLYQEVHDQFSRFYFEIVLKRKKTLFNSNQYFLKVHVLKKYDIIVTFVQGAPKL